MEEETNFNQSTIEESNETPLLSPVVMGHDIAYYVDMARQALNEERNVALLDPSHIISPFVLRDINNQLNFEKLQATDPTPVYVEMRETPTVSVFMTKLVNSIFFNSTENDDQLAYEVCHYIHSCDNDIQLRQGFPGERYAEINLHFGTEPLATAIGLLFDLDDMLAEKECTVVLIVDDAERIEYSKARVEFADLFELILRLHNISVVSAFRSKEVLERVTTKLRSPQWLTMDVTPLNYQKPKFVVPDKPEKTPKKRGRKPGSKNKKTIERENASKLSNNSATLLKEGKTQVQQQEQSKEVDSQN